MDVPCATLVSGVRSTILLILRRPPPPPSPLLLSLLLLHRVYGRAVCYAGERSEGRLGVRSQCHRVEHSATVQNVSSVQIRIYGPGTQQAACQDEPRRQGSAVSSSSCSRSSRSSLSSSNPADRALRLAVVIVVVVVVVVVVLSTGLCGQFQ